MALHLKHLISLLLIVGLTINDGFGISQTNSSTYHQSYKTASLQRFSSKKVKHFTSKKNIVLNKEVFTFFFTHFTLLKSYSKRIQAVLKLQSTVYLQINSIKIQQSFLSKILTPSNTFPSIHIA